MGPRGRRRLADQLHQTVYSVEVAATTPSSPPAGWSPTTASRRTPGAAEDRQRGRVPASTCSPASSRSTTSSSTGWPTRSGSPPAARSRARPSPCGVSPSRPAPTTCATRRRSRSSIGCSQQAPRCRRSTPPSSAPKPGVPAGVTVCADAYDATEDADVLTVLTEWDDFRWLDPKLVAATMPGRTVVDGRNLLDARRLAPRRVHPSRHRALMAHHLLAGGGGFIGSHMADVFLGARRHGHRRRQLRHRPTQQHRPPRSAIRASRDRARHHRRLPAGRHRGHRTTRCSTSPARPRRSTSRRCRSRSSPSAPPARATCSTSPSPSRRRFFLASTSEVYGDPLVHPQPESYLGNVSSHRPAQLLRRGEAVQRGDHDGVPPRPRPRRAHRAHLQHLRRAHAPRRRSRGEHLRAPGTARRADHPARRRHPDPQLLPRQRRGRRSDRRARRAASPDRSTSATRASSRCASSPR